MQVREFEFGHNARLVGGRLEKINDLWAAWAVVRDEQGTRLHLHEQNGEWLPCACLAISGVMPQPLSECPFLRQRIATTLSRLRETRTLGLPVREQAEALDRHLRAEQLHQALPLSWSLRERGVQIPRLVGGPLELEELDNDR